MGKVAKLQYSVFQSVQDSRHSGSHGERVKSGPVENPLG